MRPVCIRQANAHQIEVALRGAFEPWEFGVDRDRNSLSVSGVIEAAAEAEERLHMLPLGLRIGAVARFDPWHGSTRWGGRTVADLRRAASGWRLVGVERAPVIADAALRRRLPTLSVRLRDGLDAREVASLVLQRSGVSGGWWR